LAFALSLPGQELDRAYEALRAGKLEAAREAFEKGLSRDPGHQGARVDYAYLLLRMGETREGREEIRKALEAEPEREALWLEYAFLCHETGLRPEAFETFLRLRTARDPNVKAQAEEAWKRLDDELATATARWREAAAKNPDSYSVHEELARLLEERNDYVAAATEYRLAFGLKPDKRKYLLDIARVEREALRIDYEMAALLAASRGPQAWVAEQAKEQMTTRYPYVYEFEYAIQMDPLNVGLRREFGFLLLEMGRQKEAITVFTELLKLAPEDALANAQVAFLKGSREMLVKVAAQGETSLSAVRELAEKSLQKGYLKDALAYFNEVQASSPADYETMLRLGWTQNMLKNDREALKWFNLARRSPDAPVAAEAEKAYRNLRPALAPVQSTSWMLPFYSSRWREGFAYGQTKMEIRVPGTRVRPYLSSRLIADFGTSPQRLSGGVTPQALSESAVVVAAGLAAPRWNGLLAWGEVGSAWQYFGRRQGTARIKPDYRGGVNYARTLLKGRWATTADAVFLSRFDNNTLFYWQNRVGKVTGGEGSVTWQAYWNFNVTADAKRLDWANFFETGPGLRIHFDPLPKGLYLSVDYLEGWHFLRTGEGRARRFRDVRAGLWYAFTR
jgi:Tfp pilus assembly protein PilF